ncbi:MmgE/PrpD family protein [Sphingorhabdus contaminans]|uniref:MmgE/PrpD family protein n=1 Tax=Sphingorhabdus contaminans TaxID=1343899 RepID=A0A553WAD5_9SPHN|nr:MmgE/PrpD family protein [Sphingorhabdus contaminans]TSB01650.1 MmgE/PrpD family protein [Sphingorhabdus contaminans]
MKHSTAILNFAAAPHVLTSLVRADTLRLLTDTLAVMAAGAASPEAAHLQKAGVDPSFAKGFAVHCLEWDAVHEPAVVHALSVVTAALLATAERNGGSDPEAFLTALAVGVDVASGLGLSATGPMKFFRPATAGVIGAALAVARLERLPRAQFDDVLGLAYSFAGGTMQAHVEASIALPLQIGRAAQAAIQAVDLVKAGLDGPHDALEGPFGYAALLEPLDLARYTADLGKVWRIREVSIKPFPSGRASHGALGALQTLRRDGAVTIEAVAAIELFAPPLIHRLVGRPYRSGAAMSYNRLCLAFLAPLMLRDGHIDPRCTETIPVLAEKVAVHLDGNPDGNALSPQRLVVTLNDGRTIEQQIGANLGSPDAPMSPDQYAAKYALCRTLAGACDARLFNDPLSYITDPR